MKPEDKKYKIINSKTGNTIHYCTIDGKHSADEIKEELEKIKTQVAIQNGVYQETLYWEEER